MVEALPSGVEIVSGWTVRKIARVERFGSKLPDVPGFDPAQPPASLQAAEGSFLACLAPGEWLHFGPALPPPQINAEFLRVDLGPGRLLLRLSPAMAATALAAYCPLDPAVDLAPGRVARSLFADADALLAFEGDALLLMADISITDYVLALLGRLQD